MTCTNGLTKEHGGAGVIKYLITHPMAGHNETKHIVEKHRVAVALAVLKEKPENVTIENYLQELRDKINTNVDEDIDVTVCSDDFNLDDDSINGNNKSETLCGTNTSEHVYNNFIINDTVRNYGRANFVINESVHNENSLQVNNDLISNRNSVSILENVLINDNTIRNYNDNDIVDQITNTQESVSILKDVVIKRDSYVEARGKTDNTTREKNIEWAKIPESQKLLTQELIETQDLEATYCNTQIAENTQNYHSNTNNVNYTDKEIYKNIDTQATTQNYTHVSQSQNNSNIIIIKDNLFKSKAISENINTNDNIEPRSDVFANQNIIIPKQNTSEFTQTEFNENFNYHRSTYNGPDNRIYYNESDDTNKVNNIGDHNHTNQNNKDKIEVNEMQVDSIDINKYDTLNLRIDGPNSLSKNNTSNDKVNDETVEFNYAETNEDTVREELISFKVIEELNTVKCYLNRTVDRRTSVENSLDSGYKSDSQSRGSYRNCNVGQSGTDNGCIPKYTSVYWPVVMTSRIRRHIVLVLANLIEKLHEEEKYLLFLDDVLEKVDGILQDIISNKNNDDSLLEREQVIHRLLLLNTSPHIQKYTIQKIITYLEELQPRLCSKEELFEISNTEEMENLCYIFHILEVLLSRYVKSEELATPKSSQTELKKSTISDLWRKRFYPAHHRTNTEIKPEVSPKESILKKCAVVLNKFIVSCMSGYSLVSYVALQCFNALQT
ncbi:hypothetical protein evm_013019 [Chilo suppressalis]|nr:hypothetical protein evm_013019 [Chilo suppressalis]